MATDTDRLVARVLQEESARDRAFFDSLSDHEKKVVVDVLSGRGSDLLWEVDYVNKPVDVVTFLTDKDYLGMSLIKNADDEAQGNGVFEVWADTLVQLFDPSNSYWELILSSSIGTGKCLSGKELLQSNQGLVTAAYAYSDPGVTHLVSESGLRKIVAKHDEGLTDTVTVRTKHGHEITVRPNHRLRVLRNLVRTWVEAKDIRAGDCVLLRPSEASEWGSVSISQDLAELLGWLVAEGSLKGKTCTELNIHADEVGYITSLLEKLGLRCRVSYDKRSNYSARVFVVCGSWIRKQLPADDSSTNVTIPEIVMCGERSVLCAFLRGLFSGDGTISGARSGSVELCLASEELIRQVQVVLTLLGIETGRSRSKAAYTKDGARIDCGFRYRLRILETGLAKFRDLIGFAAGSRKAACLDNAIAKKSNKNTDHSYSFAMSGSDIDEIVGAGNPELRKLVYRLRRGQRCTVKLLNDIERAGGKLSHDLQLIASRSVLFDEVKETVATREQCYDFTVDGDPSYIGNGFVNHNTSCAVLAMVYKLYRMSCLRDPQKFYGLMPGHAIVYGIYNIFKYKAQGVAVSYFRSAVERSPYFRDVFPLNTRKTNDLEFPNSVKIGYGSTALHSIGENLFSVLIDETEFMKAAASEEEKGQAWTLYNSTLRRMESRYMRGGEIPGLMIQISSKASADSYLSERIKSRGDASDVLIVEKTGWEVKPWRYTGQTFWLFVGDSHADPRIIENDAELDKIPDKTGLMKVPEEHRLAFSEDIHGALRDLANVASGAANPLIPRRDRVFECIDKAREHPFTKLEFHIGLDDDNTIEDFLKVDDLFMTRQSRFVPRVSPQIPRFIHLDLAVSGDACGFAMGHVAGFNVKSKEDPANPGHTFETKTPRIYVDMMLRVVPAKGSQIRLNALRDFIFALRAYGYPIAMVTADTYQSTSLIQELIRSGFNAEVLSVDVATEKEGHPYAFLREAIMDRRIQYYNYPQFLAEVVNLQRFDVVSGGKIKWKVDHPPKMRNLEGNPVKGAKDVADAVAGVVKRCMMQEPDADPPAISPAAALIKSVPPKGTPRFNPDDDSWIIGNDYRA